MRRILRAAMALTIAALAAGCGSVRFSGAYDLPLPGGADVGDHPYRVVAEFVDVLDLVPNAAVRVNNVPVGRVEEITLAARGWTAEVTMLVNGDVHLPANARAHLVQSSLLGEKFVSLVAPADASGTLANGARIPLSRTNRNPEIEEVLGALSMLLNGGGIEQINTITAELNAAMQGNEAEIHSLLGQLETLLNDLDTHRDDITTAIDAVNRFSATLAARDQEIGTVLDDLAPGLAVLTEQRAQLVTLLEGMETLSSTAIDIINASKEDFVADLKALGPILQELANAGEALPESLQVLITYPFTDAVLDAVKGDYLNVYLSVTAEPGTKIVAPLVIESTSDEGAQ